MNIHAEEPIREGRYWRMPDGSLVPYIAGGAGDDEGGDDGGSDAGGSQDDFTAELDSLRREMKSSRAEAAKYRRQLREKEDALSNIDVDKYNELIAKEEEAANQKLEDKGRYDELLAEHQRRSEAQLTKATETLDMWKRRYEAQVVDNVLLSSATDRAIDSNEATTLLRAQHKFNITESGDVEVLGADGQVVLDDKGSPITPKHMMTTFLDNRPHLCKPKGGGSGSRGSGAPSKGSPQDDPNLTGAARITAALKKQLGG